MCWMNLMMVSSGQKKLAKIWNQTHQTEADKSWIKEGGWTSSTGVAGSVSPGFGGKRQEPEQEQASAKWGH